MNKDVIYEEVIRPALFGMDPEQAHQFVHGLLKSSGPLVSLLPYRYTGNDLVTEIAGTQIFNPIGLAAGFDKNATLLPALGSLGFGFAEIGSITARATAGNPRPRVFRLPDDKALINRLGLNGDGADVVAERIRLHKTSLPIAVNIAKTNDPTIVGDAAMSDILHSFDAVRDLDLMYIAFNASCPNTQEGCMQEKRELSTVLLEIQKRNVRKVPLFLKVSPDSSDRLIEDIAEIAQQCSLAGFICGNTTTTRTGLKTDSGLLTGIGAGGLSGPPLKPLALNVCKRIATIKQPHQQIIAVGGVASGADAYEFIRHGASAVQLYTALIYKGPALIRQICWQLHNLLQKDGLAIKEAVGTDLRL